MSDHFLLLLTLQTVGLLLAVLVIWNYSEIQQKMYQKKIEEILRTHLDTMLTATVGDLESDLRKTTQTALTNTETVLTAHQQKLTNHSEQLITEFTRALRERAAQALNEQDKQLAELLSEKRSALTAELTTYREQKIAELDATSQKLVEKVMQRKVWRLAQTADADTIAKAALQEIIASGELSV